MPPSRAFEGLRVCLLEAGSMCIPVLVAKIACTPETVRDGVTGGVVLPGDIEELSQAMAESLTSQAAESDEILERAERLVHEAYTVDVVSRRVHNVYLHMLGNR